jgi:VanZ family protein
MHLKDNLRKLSDQTYFILAILWTSIIIYLSLISAKEAKKFNVWDIVGFDKLGHLIFYATLTILWYMSLCRKQPEKKIILFFIISFGVLLEICQLYLFNGRSFEIYDIAANIAGSLIGWILFKNLIN